MNVRVFPVQSISGFMLLAVFAGGMAQAHQVQPADGQAVAECPAPVQPSGVLAPWADPVPVASARDAANLAAAQLRVGQAVRLSLHPANEIRYPAAPGKTGGNGGLAEVTIEEAGNYRVALGAPAWIDLVGDGKALTSIAHGHGPKCSTIRKMVDFTLKPGRYTLTISANPSDQTQALVVRLPAQAD